ncbi:hypothetical protein A2673_04205 [Candidatus Kaiserbacteria bacterium RIFCSPHIGHO2_01_FULL_50_13]|uniref:Uncharacterized protein n=1 Tax=Candidatus Kaiserbacteria bacterium RIFCSPLOWO2_01_FULL_50_24 TaxID=1798507 RepID=A0A1F6EN00_9BACT|nr:MAG: hypothetical protein A2673_04205 [Candidatus Kaiserbacteria bacterium RIFCSPHIGHO2_01_FULL_50_13]OGG75011.1 MAG: hypothetical protein A3A34_02595 [Candidatus Kaiserbacteria bacterium RIFCSPLOWO2_01_FULL_50_24]OGG82059.1 MAG: hypothetical protein A3H74_04285 [Candidatus Kaiserbacteria bacterium RIFCSPLOWO2_02_FULL_51_13]
MKCISLIEEAFEMAGNRELIQRFAPVLDIQKGERTVGKYRNDSIASEEVKLLCGLSQYYHWRSLEIESRLEKDSWGMRRSEMELEAMQAERLHNLFFFLLAATLRYMYPRLSKHHDVEFAIRKGWVVVWSEFSDNEESPESRKH